MRIYLVNMITKCIKTCLETGSHKPFISKRHAYKLAPLLKNDHHVTTTSATKLQNITMSMIYLVLCRIRYVKDN